MVVPGLWPAAAVHSDSSSSGGEGARAPYIISIHLHLHSVGPGTSSGWLAVTKSQDGRLAQTSGVLCT